MHFCINYLQCFISEEILTNQKLSWTEVSRKQGVNTSEKGSNAQFSNYYNQLEAPFVIYADFAFSLKENPNLIETKLLPLKLITIRSILLVVMVTQLVVCIAASICQPVNTYPGENAVYRLIEKMLEKGEHCREIIEKYFKEELKTNKENERHVELIIFFKYN